MLCGVLLSAASLAAENEALPTEEVQTEENTVPLDGGAELSLDGETIGREYYSADKSIWYDTTDGSTTTSGTGVQSVQLLEKQVQRADSSKAGAPSVATVKTADVYGKSPWEASTYNAQMKVTLSEGYYVERIVIACIHGSSATAYSCSNWGEGNAYDKTFTQANHEEVDGKLTLTQTIDAEKAFCHDSNAKGNVGYFILIKVAKATPTTGSLTITKTVQQRADEETRVYYFTVKQGDEVVQPVSVTVENGPWPPEAIITGSKTIDGLAPGTYTITEDPVNDIARKGVLYYCVSSGPATVTVEAGKEATAAFTNTYHAYTPAKVELEVSKTVTGTDAPTDELYTFELADNQTTTGTVPCTGAGTAKFELEFTNVGEYSFVVREGKGTNPRCTYDATEYHVTVTVTESQTTAGALEATYSVTKQQESVNAIVFTNNYKEYTPVTLTLPNVTKMLSGTDIPTDEEYTFVLKDEDNEPLQTVKHTGRGEVGFTAITYNTAGTYRYTVSEEKGTNPLCDYDGTVYTLNVEVTKDESTGGLKAEYNVTKPQGKELVPVEAITFTNNYKDYTPATLTLPQIEKKLTGDAPAKAETYRFKLTAKDNAPMPEKDSVSVTGAGKVSFPEIKYTKAGTYVYEISEVAGTDKSCTYDKTVYTVTVTVTEDMDGTLSAKSAIMTGSKTASSILFTNSYPKAEKKAPSTGDSSRLGLWLGLALAGGCGCAAAVVLTKRREH